MAAMLHDSDVRADRMRRVEALRPDATRAWGKMTVDQMLWHVNEALREVVDNKALGENKIPFPKGMLRFMVLYLPWTKSAPTHPNLVATDKPRADFETQKKDCLRLIDGLAAKDINGQFPVSGTFGTMNGPQWSRLMAKHLDHHLRQFSA